MVLPPPPMNRGGVWRSLKHSTTPPPLNRDGFRRSEKISATTPPPLNRDGFRRSQKISATTPPPLNLGDLALHTKGAPSLGKSWICDCNVTHSDNEYRPLFYSIPFAHVRLVEQISMVLIWPSAYCNISGKTNYIFLDNLNVFLI